MKILAGPSGVVLFVLLAACEADAVLEELPGTELAVGPALVASAALPGRDLTLTVSGATPRTTIRLVSGTGPGAGPCLPVLGGGCLGVAGAALVGGKRADATGAATWTFPIALTAPIGLSRAWQAVVEVGGQAATTAVLVTAVQDPVDVCDTSGAGWSAPAASWECEVLGLINDLRAQGGADCGTNGVFGPTFPLVMTEELQLAARVHTRWMADNNTLTHASPGGPLGDTLIERVENAGYTSWRRLEENIAEGVGTPQATANLWMRSDDHCANLMSPQVRDLGVGTATGSGATWWTAVFGQPR